MRVGFSVFVLYARFYFYGDRRTLVIVLLLAKNKASSYLLILMPLNYVHRVLFTTQSPLHVIFTLILSQIQQLFVTIFFF